MTLDRRTVLKSALAGGCFALPLFGPKMMLPARADVIAEATTLELRPMAGQGRAVVFDADALAALPTESFTTTTIWTEGPTEFTGPTLASVLEAAEAGQGNLQLRAENDYTVDMPREFVEDSAPIIATHRNGLRFSRREKGPLWLVFPYDSAPRYQREDIFAYSVWQLVRIDVVSG